MADEIYEKVNLMLRLYDMRREEKLRKARAWFLERYTPSSAPEEFMAKYPPGSEENAFIRMTLSYWEMCSGIFNRGLLDEDMYHANSGEAWAVWEKLKFIAPVWRQAFGNPTLFAELEAYCQKLEAWREKRAPGTTERTRQMMQWIARERVAQDAKAT
jgi:hypothetical protein